MGAMLEIESTLTDRYQTTIPDAVRRTLKLRKRDKIRYVLQPDGKVLLARAESGENEDPAINRFLKFLARDIEAHPQNIRPLSKSLRNRIKILTDGVDLDLDAALDPKDD
jgi:antitoxin PrlF